MSFLRTKKILNFLKVIYILNIDFRAVDFVFFHRLCSTLPRNFAKRQTKDHETYACKQNYETKFRSFGN